MVMYRPFLHYVTGNSQERKIDKRSFACAAACVSVARNVVHITAGMKEKKLLNGSYWFTMYTTYFAVLSLLFFILENPESATVKDGILKDALEGKNALAGLAKNSMAADRCAQSLNVCFVPHSFFSPSGQVFSIHLLIKGLGLLLVYFQTPAGEIAKSTKHPDALESEACSTYTTTSIENQGNNDSATL